LILIPPERSFLSYLYFIVRHSSSITTTDNRSKTFQNIKYYCIGKVLWCARPKCRRERDARAHRHIHYCNLCYYKSVSRENRFWTSGRQGWERGLHHHEVANAHVIDGTIELCSTWVCLCGFPTVFYGKPILIKKKKIIKIKIKNGIKIRSFYTYM